MRLVIRNLLIAAVLVITSVLPGAARENAQQLLLLSGGAPSYVRAMTTKAGGVAPSASCAFTLGICYVPGVGTIPAASFLTVSRASSETCQDSAGNVVTVGNNVPCITNLGLGVWEGRTNSVPTSDMTGVVAADNLLVNGYFATAPPSAGTGWTSVSFGTGVVFSQGSVSITGDGSNSSYIEQNFTTVNGQTYEVNGTTGGSTAGVTAGTTQGGTSLLNTTCATSCTLRFTATGASTWLRFSRTQASAVVLSAVSVQAELVTNGDFALNPINASQNTVQNGWQWRNNAGTGTVVWTGSNSITLTGDNANFAEITSQIATVSGITYTITADVTGNVSTVKAGTTAYSATFLSVNPTPGTGLKFQFTATGATTFITFSRLQNTGSVIDNVSVQSAGKLPNNWGFAVSVDFIATVVGLTTESGFPTVDVRYVWLNASGHDLISTFGSVSGAVGDVRSGTLYARLVAGSNTNITHNFKLFEIGGTTGSANLAFVPTSAAVGTQRNQVTYVNASVGTTTNFTRYSVTATGVADYTLRFAAPQLELNPSTQALTAPTTAGAVNGSPGTMPVTGGVSWADTAAAEGLTRTLTTASDGGQNTLQIALSGTVTSGVSYTVQPDNRANTSQVAVSPGEQVVGTVWYRTVVDSANFTSVAVQLLFLDNTGSQLGGTNQVVIPKPGTITQFSTSATAPANTVTALLRVIHNFTGTPVIAYTYEVGPWSLTPNRGMATPWISTTSAAVARAADVIQVAAAYRPTFADFYSLYSAATPAAPIAYSLEQGMLSVSDNSNLNRGQTSRIPLTALYETIGVRSGTGFSLDTSALTQGVASKGASAFQSGNSASVLNGGAASTSVSVNTALGAVLNTIYIGNTAAGGVRAFNGTVAEFAIWPTTRIPNTGLQNLTLPYLLNRDLCAANDNACPAANDNTPAFLEKVG